jgi:hypothetical protein
MRCFVAMAFGYKDADAVFEKLISPAVKAVCGTLPRRVDRIEHNDDIDNRIIQEIEDADFVIADLTYARPSVYFEAGYAQRKIPVVYTVRRDHFRGKPREQDPHGNERVHFDLQMKNIIDWQKPGDNAFLRRLKSRIRHVIRPLLAKQKIDAERARAASSFAALSFVGKIKASHDAALQVLRKHGFKPVPYQAPRAYGDRSDDKPGDGSRLASYLARSEGGTLSTVTLVAMNSVTKTDVKALQFVGRRSNFNLNLGGALPKRIEETFLVCSLGKASHATVAPIFSGLDYGAEANVYSGSTIYPLPKGAKPNFRVVHGYDPTIVRIREAGDGAEARLSIQDGYFGHPNTADPSGWKRVAKVVETPVTRRFAFVDRIKDTESLKERIVATLLAESRK